MWRGRGRKKAFGRFVACAAVALTLGTLTLVPARAVIQPTAGTLQVTVDPSLTPGFDPAIARR